jgi:hypothetical protein
MLPTAQNMQSTCAKMLPRSNCCCCCCWCARCAPHLCQLLQPAQLAQQVRGQHHHQRQISSTSNAEQLATLNRTVLLLLLLLLACSALALAAATAAAAVAVASAGY